MSDQDTTIFDNKTTVPAVDQPNNGAPSNDDLSTLLDSIKNERGERKYDSIPKALEGLKHAQDFIPTLQSEKKALEDELNKLRAENEKLKELEKTLERISTPTEPDRPAATSLDAESVARLVEQTLSKQEQQKVELQNKKTVVTTLVEKYGTEAEKEYIKKAIELGIGVEEFNALAAKSPKAVLQFFQLAPKNETVPSPGTRVNTTDFTPPQASRIGKNDKTVLIGATTEDRKEESKRAKEMVDELEKQGMSVHDLTNPKNYFKLFK